MTVTGYCRYPFNASEIYQRQKPGTGVETHCGAKTFPAVDVPEYYVDEQGQYRATNRMLPREYPDPHCPDHGGSPEPPPEPVTPAHIAVAQAELADLQHRYELQRTPATDLQVSGNEYEGDEN